MEQKQFTIHKDVIFSIINAQSGTLGKALLEAVMNSIDAGGSYCRLTLTTTGFTAEDDGKGFTSRQEIEDFFGCFGTPHQEGDVPYGRYRIGRGQLMSFATNVWRTGTFLMDVDIKNRGLDYLLKDDLPAVKGCMIQGKFYDKLSPSELAATVRELEQLCKYAQIPVELNGSRINILPQEEKWDIETDDAYIRLKGTGSLAVYNLGVLVREYYGHYFGCGGTVVSKKQLKVNFARNDVLLNQCQVWKRIRAHLKTQTTERVKKKPKLTEDELSFMAQQIKHGELDSTAILAAKVLTDIQGRQHPVSKFNWFNLPITTAPEAGNAIADKLHQQKIAFVLHPTTLDRFGVNCTADLIKELKTALESACGYARSLEDLTIAAFDQLSRGFTESAEVIPQNVLNEAEKAVFCAIDKHWHRISYAVRMSLGEEAGHIYRKLRVGKSEAYEAWTDAQNYVALERGVLKRAKDGVGGFAYIVALLVHELCHDTADANSHVHDGAFYEKFHEILLHYSSPLVNIPAQMFQSYLADMQRRKLKLVRNQLRDADAAAVFEDAEVEDPDLKLAAHATPV